MVVVSGNISAAPLIGSKVIRDRASDGSVWSEKGPRVSLTPELDQSCAGPRRSRRPNGVKKHL